MEAFERALSTAANEDSMSPRLIASGTIHEFHIGESVAHVQLAEGSVIWCLSKEKAWEILDLLAPLTASSGPRHQYIDIDRPAQTLILSKDEYLGASWLDEG